MPKRQSTRVITMATIVAAWMLTSHYGLGAKTGYSLIDVMVWGADLTIDATAHPATVRAEIDRHRRRFETYESRRTRPRGSALLAMVYDAEVRYERRLVAVTTASDAGELALAYVSDLRPCYEWEGFHDCPEREARFAATYQAAHPRGPFRYYLPLLEAHRWLCTAEAYEYEKAPTEAGRARRSYEAALTIAKQSASLLVRTAAQELAARQRCLGEK